ncbi:Phage head morphogenesis protein gp7 [Sodalis praecaptivus]|uniref:Phage head morphogenesis protein gp7 n=1 Tax=Sodalis praecaptivus TaxID=1239307 RepID=W0I0D2_9GAMM|nr:minor capsid protein [Sodalis praecaptivus]AHF77908.1 Phage head morphogenesis protein gp7 [Sodalis praecaptivus]
MATLLHDNSVLIQTLIERLKASQGTELTTLYNELRASTGYVLQEYDGTINTMGQRDEISKLLANAMYGPVDGYSKQLLALCDQLSGDVAQLELNSLSSIPGMPGLIVPDTDKIIRQVHNRPLSIRNWRGELLLDPFIKDWETLTLTAANNAVLRSWREGQTIQQLTTALRGTRALNGADGIIGQYVKNADAIARTAIQHTATVARETFFDVNDDVVDKVQFVATLDNRTTAICRSLDGREFAINVGPRPPLHIRCRSTIIPVLADSALNDILREGETRASSDGYISSDETYYQWLLRQPDKQQDMIIGKNRGKLLRDGGLSAERFAALQLDRNFEPMTLEEMRKIAPEAFKRAGI